MTAPTLLPHQHLLDKADRWFDRSRASLLGALPCRRGCCRCCVGVFAITMLDADALEAGLAGMPEETRLDIQQRAMEQATAMEQVYPRLTRSRYVSEWNDSELDELADRFSNLQCPALAPDGSCRVYAFRPLTCRTMGIPVEEERIVRGACEVQTAIPLIKLSQILRAQEDDLAAQEAHALQHRKNAADRSARPAEGEEVLLPYGFLK